MLHLINQRRRKILQAMKKRNPPSWGFIVFGLVTVDHFALGFGHELMNAQTHKLYSYIVIPFSIFVLIGIGSLTYRRFISRPKTLGKISPTSGFVALFISILMITYLLGETGLSPIVWRINWWIHSLIILAFLFLIPRSKHLHLVLAPINIFFKPFDLPDHTPVNIDLEGSEDELDAMLADLTEMTKNQALGLDQLHSKMAFDIITGPAFIKKKNAG